jgi:hypothetical protein
VRKLGTSALIALFLVVAGCGQKKTSRETADAAGERVMQTGEAPSRAGKMRGLFTYMADAAAFSDCDTGARLPVAMEAGYLELERGYLEARSEPGAPLLVTFEGRVELRPSMEGDVEVETVIVERFGAVWPGEDCEGLD